MHASCGSRIPRPARAVSPEAVDVLANIPRVQCNPHVIPGKKRGTHMHNLHDPWERVCRRAGIGNARLHDCRQSVASGALAPGEGLPMIGRLLGHTRVETTAWYAHLARNPVRGSVVRVTPTALPPISSGTTARDDGPGLFSGQTPAIADTTVPGVGYRHVERPFSSSP